MSAPPRRPPPGQGRSGRIVPALQAQARAPAEGDFNDPIPARAHMLRQLAAQGLRDAQVLRALGVVDRRRFVEAALARRAYEDTALPIGLEQTISKPSVVARMVSLLRGEQVDAQTGKLGRVLSVDRKSVV